MGTCIAQVLTSWAAGRSVAITGFAIAAVMLLIFTRLQNPAWMIAALAASSFAAEFTGPVSWTTSMDLGGRYVGSMGGAMNTLGQLGGAVAPAARDDAHGRFREGEAVGFIEEEIVAWGNPRETLRGASNWVAGVSWEASRGRCRM